MNNFSKTHTSFLLASINNPAVTANILKQSELNSTINQSAFNQLGIHFNPFGHVRSIFRLCNILFTQIDGAKGLNIGLKSTDIWSSPIGQTSNIDGFLN